MKMDKNREISIKIKKLIEVELVHWSNGRYFREIRQKIIDTKIYGKTHLERNQMMLYYRSIAIHTLHHIDVVSYLPPKPINCVNSIICKRIVEICACPLQLNRLLSLWTQ